MREWTWRKFRNFQISNAEDSQRAPSLILILNIVNGQRISEPWLGDIIANFVSSRLFGTSAHPYIYFCRVVFVFLVLRSGLRRNGFCTVLRSALSVFVKTVFQSHVEHPSRIGGRESCRSDRWQRTQWQLFNISCQYRAQIQWFAPIWPRMSAPVRFHVAATFTHCFNCGQTVGINMRMRDGTVRSIPSRPFGYDQV